MRISLLLVTILLSAPAFIQPGLVKDLAKDKLHQALSNRFRILRGMD